MPGFGHGYGALARRLPAPLALPLHTVAASGWEVAGDDPPPPGTLLSLRRQGFDAGGYAVEHAEALPVATRIRQPYPDHARWQAERVALADYVYATDRVEGARNDSGEVSPRPVAAWVMPSRLLVGEGVAWEIVAFHRNARAGRQVACVRVRATNGAQTTPWQTVAETAVSTLCEDAAAVEVYRGALDLAGMPDGPFWLEARVHPWVGGWSSVRVSDDAGADGFSPRHFLKDTARAAAPPIAHVAAGGSDAAGQWSRDPATARAVPFASVLGAQNALYVQTAVTGGIADGCRIRIGAGAFPLASPPAATVRAQTAAALVIERDPAVPRGDAQVTLGAYWTPNFGTGGTLAAPLDEGAALFHDVTLVRTASNFTMRANTSGPVVPLFVQFWNVAVDNGTSSVAWVNAASASDAVFGMAFTAPLAGNVLSGASSRRLLRGVRADMAGRGFNAWRVIGCQLENCGGGTLAAPDRGFVAYANRFLRSGTAGHPFYLNPSSDAATMTDVAVVGNLFEWTGTNASLTAVAIANDRGNTLGVLLHHNSFTGARDAGRVNLLYDGFASSTVQSHRLMSVRGNLFSQLNFKGDVFAQRARHTGSFAFDHGVGCAGNVSMFAPNAPATENQSFPGLNASIGTSDTVRADPLFVLDRATTVDASRVLAAGAGGGDYRLQPGSPARGRVAQPLLGFDLAGVARGGGAQPAGAYG